MKEKDGCQICYFSTQPYTTAMRLNRIVILLLLPLLFSCENQSADNSSITAFVGATLIDGTGASPINDAVLLVENGRIRQVGSKEVVDIPKGAQEVDMAGKYVMPGMINGHGHIGGTEGLQGGKYSRENLLRDLALNARYGVTTVVSLGGDEQASIEVRDAQETGSLSHSRLFVAGTIVTGDSPEEVKLVVQENARNKVDFIKIRVDDNLRASVKMPSDVYSAVIEEAHKHGIPVASHLYYLKDAKGLLNAGTDYIAHSIRDKEVDQELIELIKAKDVYYCPTLMREVSVFAYAETPDFLADKFLLNEVEPEIIEALKAPERQKRIKENPRTKVYEEALVMAMSNLKKLSDNGVKIVMGTDAGPPARFQGYFEHKELELMVAAGLTPMQTLVAATGNAAKHLNLKDIGTLEKGNWADFILLEKNPLEDITNTQSLLDVWIAGNKVPEK
ncbi:MAG: amidohydrolase family protein [Roseivirga sp.]|nr:amidohydrolase family protein [Roseivirga sp.]